MTESKYEHLFAEQTEGHTFSEENAKDFKYFYMIRRIDADGHVACDMQGSTIDELDSDLEGCEYLETRKLSKLTLPIFKLEAPKHD